jgi:putative nucleotidyltransferase with HDIG domain
MSEIQTQFINPAELKIGMYVYLDLSWMQHPFPVSHFEIRSQAQIDTIRTLGLKQVRYIPPKAPVEVKKTAPKKAAPAPVLDPVQAAARERRQLLASQYASLKMCERQYAQAAQNYKEITDTLRSDPSHARHLTEGVIRDLLSSILGEDEAVIRLLSESMGEKSSLHSINVTVISLLLGKTLSLSKPDMMELGIGAMLHDIGKMEIQDRYRYADEFFNSIERNIYESHVLHGVSLASKMGVSQQALTIIAQHHEYIDGSGYPSRIVGDKLSPLSRILSLVNWYDNLCNPSHSSAAITPHEALAQMFAQNKGQFHLETLSAFIHMMGVYPPGSVVQLTDERYALVVSVNAARPIRPYVVIHDQNVPRDEALVINLQDEPKINIHRSIKPTQLPKASFDYLSPRKRTCYFFENVPRSDKGQAA